MSEVAAMPVLEARGIVKRYPGQVALKNVTFGAFGGAVNVLIGENGAGKSTLMRILSGVETADEGAIWMDGKPVKIGSPQDASRLGIAIVHQELAVLPNLDISENIFLGRELTAMGMVDRGKEDREATSALERLQKPFETHTPAGHLSLGCRQVLEIARALARKCRVLILDEPTSALSQAECEALFEAMQTLVADGIAVIYISHRLEELMRLGDRFTVLRSGEVVGRSVRGEATREWIVRTMSGRDAQSVQHREVCQSAEVVLEVQGLSLPAVSGGGEPQAALHEVSFRLRKGEVLGIYGLLGAGRTELVETLAGCRTAAHPSVVLRGQMLRLRSAVEAADAGILLVPEDRQRDGLIPELSVRENIVLALGGEHWLKRKRETAIAAELIRKLRIDVRDMELPVTALSGGNQQKVLLARCLVRSPKVLLLDEPTRGVDAGAKVEIYRVLRDLAREGLSVIFTSSEIEETRELADRALVLCQGSVAAELEGDALTELALFRAASPSAMCVEEDVEGAVAR